MFSLPRKTASRCPKWVVLIWTEKPGLIARNIGAKVGRGPALLSEVPDMSVRNEILSFLKKIYNLTEREQP